MKSLLEKLNESTFNANKIVALDNYKKHTAEIVKERGRVANAAQQIISGISKKLTSMDSEWGSTRIIDVVMYTYGASECMAIVFGIDNDYDAKKDGIAFKNDMVHGLNNTYYNLLLQYVSDINRNVDYLLRKTNNSIALVFVFE